MTSIGLLVLTIVLGTRIYFPLYFHNLAVADGLPPNGNKLGLAGSDAAQMRALGASWAYAWTPDMPPTLPESVPMLYGGFPAGLPNAVTGSSQWVLGFNEPDLPSFANLTPEQAVPLWRDIEAVYHYKLLVAPAPSQEHQGWLPEFRQKYIDTYGVPPRLDALAVHCYWDFAGCVQLTSKYIGWAKAWGVKEVWVTEFAFLDQWNGTPESDAKRFVAWMEAEPLITRYAPFMSWCEAGKPYTCFESDPSLFCGPTSTEFTEIGRWYAKF